MNQKLLYRLKSWRVTQAQKEGVELFRVLPNATLDEIARVLPRTAGEFLKIKGIKEGRWKKYGAMLLAMMADVEESASIQDTSIFDEQNAVNALLAEESLEAELEIPGQRTLYTVSAFLEALNMLFAEMVVRVKGEISSVDTRDKTTYFTLKDSEDGSILSCLIFRYQYEVSGVRLEIGQEVIIEGTPGIWKPTGRLSLKAQSIEVSGVGALQKAYDDLKKKLEQEGLFAAKRKRALPEFPQRIALITSSQGAAIGDFMMNLGKFGFKISLLNASVEGKKAVFDLIDAVRFFNRHPERYDVLVIIRGGGSLESLQAFNNEALVREVAQSNIPTLCGIGHEKDVSLVALAGDMMVSTPTATARALREDFEKADASLIRSEQWILGGFEKMAQVAWTEYDDKAAFLLRKLQEIMNRYTRVQNDFMRSVEGLRFSIRSKHSSILQIQSTFLSKQSSWIDFAKEETRQYESKLAAYDPKRLLRLGYSLITKDGVLLRSVKDARFGDSIHIQLSDGSIDAEVKNI